MNIYDERYVCIGCGHRGGTCVISRRWWLWGRLKHEYFECDKCKARSLFMPQTESCEAYWYYVGLI